MRGCFRLVVLIAVSGLVAVALVFYTSSTTRNYRNCVALMWDRKHPAEVKRRQEEANFNQCEVDRLREGRNCNCKAAEGQPGYCGVSIGEGAIPPEGLPIPDNPCNALSLEELRRADAEASRDKPPR